MVAAEVEVEPTDDDGHGAVRADGDEKQGCVLHVPIRVYVEEDGKAGNGDEDGTKCKGEAVLGSIRGVGDHHGEDERTCPRGHTVELCADWRVAVRSDDAWGEVGVPIGVRS